MAECLLPKRSVSRRASPPECHKASVSIPAAPSHMSCRGWSGWVRRPFWRPPGTPVIRHFLHSLELPNRRDAGVAVHRQLIVLSYQRLLITNW
jgi:hypothetical protein